MEKRKEVPIIEIGKVKVRHDRIVVEYKEKHRDENYVDIVTKQCENIIHPDLKLAMQMLKPHVVSICEFAEAERVDVSNPSENDIQEVLKGYVVTGYSRGGSEDNAGVTIVAQKLLSSGRVMNITTPFTKFFDETGEGYCYGDELRDVLSRIEYEVDAYLFEGKFGIKQESFDFAEDDVPVEEAS
ncbi:hypothetical protein [Tannerella forsythia]|uniref:hypothetical protein n=1 Tax=Tannerella forsythia TaxID=28112 RepID=UPI000618C38A|nr:hypothetical protein [Tannerella forsythia]BAR48140.1 hypothetical protein TF3313_0561 [Tannerella forsythia 3313]